SPLPFRECESGESWLSPAELRHNPAIARLQQFHRGLLWLRVCRRSSPATKANFAFSPIPTNVSIAWQLLSDCSRSLQTREPCDNHAAQHTAPPLVSVKCPPRPSIRMPHTFMR